MVFGWVLVLDSPWAFVTDASLLPGARNYCPRNCRMIALKLRNRLYYRHLGADRFGGWNAIQGIKAFAVGPTMSQVVPDTQQEFWRAPASVAVAKEVTVPEALPTLAETCPGCGMEFLLGSRFCHACGGRRPEMLDAIAKADVAALAGMWATAVGRVQSVVAGFAWDKTWNTAKFPSWLRYLHFHEIKRWIGLPTASLIAFIIGLGCVAGALLVGLLTAKNFVDWQAIQFYRAEWLLAATASFVAGILLKKPSSRDSD